MIIIERFVFNPFMENTYVVYDTETCDAAVVDPGAESDVERERLEKFIDENGLSLKLVIATHGHFDHLAGLSYLCDRYNAQFAMSKKDESLQKMNATMLRGMGFSPQSPRTVDVDLQDGMTVASGSLSFKILATPGHSSGGVSLLMESEDTLFSGDTLFKGSIGRTDFPYGDYPALIGSITSKLMLLPMDTRVLPGHGEETTLAMERDTNPFITEVLRGEVNPTI